MFKHLINVFSAPKSEKKDYKIQSFTFFIPAPPARSTGYREKQFDKLFYEFINRGYHILHFGTESCAGENHSGMWMVFIVQATNDEAEKLNLHDEFGDQFKDRSQVKDQVEGLYYIDDKAQEL